MIQNTGTTVLARIQPGYLAQTNIDEKSVAQRRLR